MYAEQVDTIEDCLERIRAAWDAGDAKAFATEFTKDATYVIYSGTPLSGRIEIEQAHVETLARGTSMKIKVLSATFLANDVAVAVTTGGVGKGAVIPFEKMQTLTLVRRENQWKCAAFQNTEMSLDAKRLYNPDIKF